MKNFIKQFKSERVFWDVGSLNRYHIKKKPIKKILPTSAKIIQNGHFIIIYIFEFRQAVHIDDKSRVKNYMLLWKPITILGQSHIVLTEYIYCSIYF